MQQRPKRSVYQVEDVYRLPWLIAAVVSLLAGVGVLFGPIIALLLIDTDINLAWAAGGLISLPLFPVSWWLFRRAANLNLIYLTVMPNGLSYHLRENSVFTAWSDVDRIGYLRGNRGAPTILLLRRPAVKGTSPLPLDPPYMIPLREFLPPNTPLERSKLGQDIKQFAPRLFEQRWTPIT